MRRYIDGKFIGGILLIAGTSIGAGMLALPVANSATGFDDSSLFLLVCWLFMLIGALLILEVNLYLPPNTNMISMARATLGWPGQVFAWFTYLALFYSLIAAYTSGGSDVIHKLLNDNGFHTPEWVSVVGFVALLSIVVIRGIKSVDFFNRGLMGLKLGVYVCLVAMIAPRIKVSYLAGGDPTYIFGTVMVLITSFGFASIVPTLRTYFEEDISKLRAVIIIGSLIPLLAYILWDAIIMGSLPPHGHDSLTSMMTEKHATATLIHALQHQLSNPWIANSFWVFTAICMLTAFLAVSLGLSDFLADGLNLKKRGMQGGVVYGLTFGPPLLVSMFVPGLFLKGLSYGGVFCVLLLVFLPVLMAWSGRYVKKITGPYVVKGGKISLILLLAASLILVYLGFQTDF